MKTKISILLFFLAFTASAASIASVEFPESFWAKVWRCNFHISCYRQKLGATITTIASTDLISASRATINTNFTNLNTGKFELSDWYATSSAAQLTTLGVIASSTWRGSFIGVPFGGTGSSTLSSNRVLLGSGASPITVVNGFGTSGQFLTSNGVDTAPTWTTSAVSLTDRYIWTGLHSFNGLTTGIGTSTASTTLSVQGNALISGTTTSANLVVASSTTQINGVTYTWPSATPSAGSVLTSTTGGQLSWGTAGHWLRHSQTMATAATGTITAGNIPARKYLHVDAYIIKNGTAFTGNSGWWLNLVTGSTYTYRLSANGAADTTAATQAFISDCWNASTAGEHYYSIDITTLTGSTTMVNFKESRYATTVATPDRCDGTATFNTSAAFISSITFGDTAGTPASVFASSTRVAVYGGID